MDFWSTILVLFRRWYVAVPVLLLSLGSASLVSHSTPTYYSSTSVMVLTTPISGGTFFGSSDAPKNITNPMLDFAPGLGTAGGILIQTLNSPAVVEQLIASAGPTTSYQVTDGSANPELSAGSPFLHIEGKSTSATEAQGIIVQVAQRIRDELVTQQKALGAPSTTYITVTEFVPPTKPQPQRGNKMRALIAAVTISVVASLTATFGAESIFQARRRRQSGRPIAGAAADGIERNGSMGDRVPNHAALTEDSTPADGIGEWTSNGDSTLNGHLAQPAPAQRTER